VETDQLPSAATGPYWPVKSPLLYVAPQRYCRVTVALGASPNPVQISLKEPLTGGSATASTLLADRLWRHTSRTLAYS
jgi:hypothetical protein